LSPVFNYGSGIDFADLQESIDPILFLNAAMFPPAG